MDDLQLFSAQCWQFVDLMRIPVRALRVVQFRHSQCRLESGAADVLRDSQKPVYQFLQLPWGGFTIRLARQNRARFNAYSQFVNEAFQCPEYIDLTILLDALEVWLDRIENESTACTFGQHGSAVRMQELASRLGASTTESEAWSHLSALQDEFRQLAETVPGVKTSEVIDGREAQSRPATPRLSSP